MWGSYNLRYEFLDGTGSLLISEQIEVDSKAMRKVTADETVVLMCQSEVGAVDVSFMVRMLLKLS